MVLLMEKAKLFILMAAFIKALLPMIKQTGKVFEFTRIKAFMRENFRMGVDMALAH